MRGYAAIGLYHPKTDCNVGGAARAASVYGAALVVVQARKFVRYSTDTTKAWRSIPTIVVEDLWAAVPVGCVPVVIEKSKRAVSLFNFCHPERAFYIFGPEDGSVPEHIQSQCGNVVCIPMEYCMNLAATVNVVLYDRAAKQAARETMP